MGVVAGISVVPLCGGIKESSSWADIVLSKLEVSLNHFESKDGITVFEALYIQKECSNELWECQAIGGLADPSNMRCFSICIAEETGCRSCCSDSMCYQPPGDDQTFGSCKPCPAGGDGEQCALLLFLYKRVNPSPTCFLSRLVYHLVLRYLHYLNVTWTDKS